MTEEFTFVPVAVPLLKGPGSTEVIGMGLLDVSGIKGSPAPGPGAWEQEVTGPDDQGRYTAKGRFRPARPAKRRSRCERERLVAEYIKSHYVPGGGRLSIRAVAKATGIPRGTIEKLTAWKEFVKERATSESPSEGNIRALTDNMLVCIRRETDDPAEIAAARELELSLLMQQQAEDMAEDDPRPPKRRTKRDR